METDLFQLGLALGLAVDAGLMLALALSGQGLTLDNLPRYATVAVSVAVICWAGLSPLVFAFQGAVSLYVRWDAWKHRNDAPPDVEAPEPVAPDEPTKDDYDAEREAWKLALTRFFRAGDGAGGFSIRKLDGVVGSDTWPRLVHFYSTSDGGNVLRDAGGDIGFAWGHGWRLDRALMALGTNSLPLPEGVVPVISEPLNNAAPRNTPRQRKTVVEGTARPVADPHAALPGERR